MPTFPFFCPECAQQGFPRQKLLPVFAIDVDSPALSKIAPDIACILNQSVIVDVFFCNAGRGHGLITVKKKQ